MYQKHELTTDLVPEDIADSLKACGLAEKDEYMEDEADRFRECRSLIEKGKTYKQATAHFRRLDKLKQTGDPTGDLFLEVSELLAMASEQVCSRISLTEAGKILAACDLPDKEEYTSAQCDRFVEACILVKQEGKTYQEVALHFGAAQAPDESIERQELLEEVQGIQNSVSSLSSTQTMQVMQALPQMSLEQLRAIKLQFLRDLNRELREYVESGRMQAEFQAAADTVIKDPFLTWSPISDAKNRPLNGDYQQKSLPGS